jgi:hypothetical protein
LLMHAQYGWLHFLLIDAPDQKREALMTAMTIQGHAFWI